MCLGNSLTACDCVCVAFSGNGNGINAKSAEENKVKRNIGGKRECLNGKMGWRFQMRKSYGKIIKKIKIIF